MMRIYFGKLMIIPGMVTMSMGVYPHTSKAPSIVFLGQLDENLCYISHPETAGRQGSG
jgi:hypothetical protein